MEARLATFSSRNRVCNILFDLEWVQIRRCEPRINCCRVQNESGSMRTKKWWYLNVAWPGTTTSAYLGFLIVAKTGFQLDDIVPKNQEIAKIKHPILAALRGGFKCYKVFKCCKFFVHSMRLKNCYRQISGRVARTWQTHCEFWQHLHRVNDE